MNARDVRVVFMGTPAFAVPSLRALVANGYKVVACVTQPDRPAGRGGGSHAPAVKQAATDLGIAVFQPESLKDAPAVETLRSFEPHLFVVAAYGKILSRTVLAIPTRGAVNVHASVLPRWRGASPIASAILSGDATAGVSIMEMALKMDAGPVFATAELAIESDDTSGSLEPRLAELGADTLIAALPGWYDGHQPATPQAESLATYCRQIAKDDGHLSATMTAADAERAVRAYNPWPGAFVMYRGARLGVWQARLTALAATPGSVSVEGRTPVIAFRDGGLALVEVQKPGGRRISGEQFLNGERGKLESLVVLA